MAQSLFKTTFTTRMHDIDAAGIMFYARLFYHIHDAYEALLNSQEQSISTILKSDFILPISHTEADFKAPVFLNETLTIEIKAHYIKENSFSLEYLLKDQSEAIRAIARTDHVCLDATERTRKKLPDGIVQILKIAHC